MKKIRASFIMVLPAALALSCEARPDASQKPGPVVVTPTKPAAALEVPASTPTSAPAVIHMNPPSDQTAPMPDQPRIYQPASLQSTPEPRPIHTNPPPIKPTPVIHKNPPAKDTVTPF